MRTCCIILLIVLFGTEANAQQYYTVATRNGLIVRQAPDRNAKAIDTLKTETNVKAIEKKKEFQVVDAGEIIKGRCSKFKPITKMLLDTFSAVISFR